MAPVVRRQLGPVAQDLPAGAAGSRRCERIPVLPQRLRRTQLGVADVALGVGGGGGRSRRGCGRLGQVGQGKQVSAVVSSRCQQGPQQVRRGRVLALGAQRLAVVELVPGERGPVRVVLPAAAAPEGLLLAVLPLVASQLGG